MDQGTCTGQAVLDGTCLTGRVEPIPLFDTGMVISSIEAIEGGSLFCSQGEEGAIRFLPKGRGPFSVTGSDKGLILEWRASDLITDNTIGIVVPEKLNPGPLTARITYFAPVCLLFFFVLVTTIAIVTTISVHPMHYLFAAAGFFAFHLLLAYLAGHIHIHAAFVLSAATSVLLVTLYLAAALGRRFPWKAAAAGQIFFLVLFSYSFFVEGSTGIIVAVGSVVTLAILMKVTAHMNWDTVFPSMKRDTTLKPEAEHP